MTNEITPDRADEAGSRLYEAIKLFAISPAEASTLVEGYLEQSRKRHPESSASEHQSRVAKQLIVRYCRLAGTSGGLTALTGVIPGVGTLISMFGGGFTDAVVCMKLQVDMCMCLAKTFGWDLHEEDTKGLVFLLAAGGAVENLGKGFAVEIGSKAGVNLLKTYLKGASLRFIKDLLKNFGIIFTRKSLERALPLGMGVIIASGANYALTKHVGQAATKWFLLELEERAQDVT